MSPAESTDVDLETLEEIERRVLWLAVRIVDAANPLRARGGLLSYPSRTKDPDRVDFSTGSVGLGPRHRCSPPSPDGTSTRTSARATTAGSSRWSAAAAR